MAHLSGGGRERGQLLLVGVLVLAAMFIVLALVVNSAIFAENLATREDVPGSEEAVEYRAELIDGIGETVVAINRDENVTSRSELENHTRTEIAMVRSRGGFGQAISGAIVEVSYASSTGGYRIAQENASRNLTDRNATEDWTVAEDVTSVRNVGFQLRDVDTGGFEMTVSNGTTWTLTVSEVVDGVAVTVETGTGAQAECVRDRPNATSPLSIDVTGGTVGGEPCHALNRQADTTPMWLGAGVNSPYDIEFDDSDSVNGTYSMVVESADFDASLRSGYNESEPYVVSALYSVGLSYAYQNHAVAYEDTLRVAPGETPPTLSISAFYPETDKDCEWVAQETNNGTDSIKIDGQIVDCDVVTDEVVEVLNSGVVLGDIDSQNKTLDMDDSKVYGSVTTEDVADIQNGTVTRDVTTTEKNVKIGNNSAIGGAVTGNEQVEIKGESVVEGNVESKTKDSKILDGSTVEGSVTGVTLVKVNDVTVEGDVYIDESNFDCTNSVINGQNCSSYTPKDPGDWPP